MHLPYKSVTGRHTYVIYLMFFNIHAYLGFIQFINFSVWPAEMGKIKADVNALPPFKCSATSCKAWDQRGNTAAPAIQSLPCPGPPLLARGGLCFTGKRVSAAQLESKFKHLKQGRLDAPLERLVDFPKEMVPGEETRSKWVQGQPALASPHSLSK